MQNKLIEFYGQDCDGCEKMRTLLDRAEKEFDVIFERREIWHNMENDALMDKCDKGRCGGVPFVYNTQNDTFLCGEVSYEEIRKLVSGS